MSDVDAAKVLELVQTLWRHADLGVPKVAIPLWASMLRGVSFEEAEDAVRQLSDRDHAPGVGLIARTVAQRRSGVPSWEEAWQRIQELAAAAHTPRGYRIPTAEEFGHPVVAEFARERWRVICPGPSPSSSSYTSWYAQLRDAYRVRAERGQRDERLRIVGAAPERGVLPSGGPRKLSHHGAPSKPSLDPGPEPAAA